MNIIDTLKTRVATSLWGANASTSQLSMLEQFLGLFVTRLASKDLNLSDITANGQNILNRVFPEANHRDQMIDKLAELNRVNRQDAQTVVESAAPVAYHELTTMAAGQSLPQYLSSHVADIAGRLPSWATALLPAGLLTGLGVAHHATTDATYKVTDHGQTTHTTTPVQPVVTDKVVTRDTVKPTPMVEVREEKTGLAKWLLPLIALLILIPLLLWLLRSCSEKPVAEPVQSQQTTQAAPVAAAAALVPAMLSIETNDAGTATKCTAMVANDSIKNAIIDAVKAKFGDATNCDVTVDAKYDTNMPITERLNDALALVQATPNSRLDVNGNNITVLANDQATADKLVGDLKALLPAYMITGSTIPTAVPATTLSSSEIPADQASVVWEDNKVKFYFATAKTDIGEGAVEKAQEVLNQAKAGKKVGVSGYTDSTGNADFNKELSKNRAQAVKKFLMDNGVPEAQIELIKPADTTGATGQNQEGRRVDVYVIE